MGTVVHIVDSSLLTDINGFKERSTRAKNHVVIQIGAACGGVVQAFIDAKNATKPGQIDALVIYGHGAAGVQGISMGKDGAGIAEMAAITVEAIDSPALMAQLKGIGPHFSTKGVIVLHGCNVAEGDAGKALLAKLSKVTGVPVKGSDWYQIVGRTDLSGNILTASPSGSLDENTLEGLKNLGGLPAGEGMLLLGAEGFDRLLKRFSK